MSSQSSQTHVLDKSDYSEHRLVTLHNESLPPLAPSSLRIQPKILGLTTNNLSYARMGLYLRFYDFFPLPSNTPAPYNDSEKYVRISAWGYAEILDSTIPSISPGHTLYGYLPVSTGIEDFRVEFAEHNGERIEDQIIVLDKHRQNLMKIYNRYLVRAPLESLEKTEGLDSLGWDSLMQALFASSYNLSTFSFAWKEENRLHPSGTGEWSAADADLRDATVVILNASGKTGLSFAYSVRHARPKEYQPSTVIGVGSPTSVATIKKTGFYDKAVLNSDAQSTALEIEKSGTRRVVLLNFGARPGAIESWKEALTSTSLPFQLVSIGSEVEIQNPEKARKRLADMRSLTLVNSSLLREKGIEVGGKTYFDEFYKAFNQFKSRVVGLQLQWADGFEEWEKGWEAFCRDEVRADTGLVYRI